jgi:hypothetical protein
MRVTLKSMRVTAEDIKSIETDEERYDRLGKLRPTTLRTDEDIVWMNNYYHTKIAPPPSKPAVTSVDNFISTMKPMAAARAKSALERGIMSNGKLYTRSSLVESKVLAGAKVVLSPEGKRRLQIPNGAFLDESQISKTAMDYAEYLINNPSLDR